MVYTNKALQAAKLLMTEDVAYCMKQHDSHPAGQAERRCLIRAEFSFINAWLSSCQYQGVFGESARIPKKSRTIENVEGTINVLAQTIESSFIIDKQDPGWCAMIQAYKIRDRITHPKSPDDLLISDKSMKVFIKAVQWFANTCEKMNSQRSGLSRSSTAPL